MQNGYARTSGLEEACQIASLVNEAVALGCPDPQRQRIEIVREVVACTVRLDRHRLLQILVNLIANARDAVTGRPTARISVTTLTDGDHLEIRVTDTGVGIAADAIQRVFSAGFTTKPNGHGYGLHSSALSAKHLGGVLSCASPGVGGGATFTVRIPVRKGSHDAA
jgi:C4-dicarboxylate-specific signal transduction histidine kinase